MPIENSQLILSKFVLFSWVLVCGQIWSDGSELENLLKQNLFRKIWESENQKFFN